ncbi:hypothetical protein RUM44_013952 [Polyplax serrata]|uniref:Inositol-tetrakisphosphate 1-kinase n=1 Tax=Polyplax serrata TaxID=468196 RepID=A0ABR1BHG8_POLSC
MENNKTPSKKIIGYWMSEKKTQKLNWSEFKFVCKKHGFDLIKVDLTKSLDNQGPFSVIVHKLTDIIVQANKQDQQASVIIEELERYMCQHPEVAIIDPLYNVRQLLDRYKSYSLIHNNAELLENAVFTPTFVEIVSHNVEENLATLQKAGVQFPFVCKPSVNHGSSEAHKMAIIFNEKGVRDCKPCSVAQTFINHNAILYKIYCVGEEYFVVERPSLKNFYSNDHETIFFCTHDVSKSDSTSSLTVLDEDDPSPKSTALDHKRLDRIVKAVRKEIGLALMGIDVVVENHTNRYAIIDINAYPGYDGYPNFFDSLMRCIVKTVECHEANVTPTESKLISKKVNLFSTSPNYGTEGISTGQGTDQEDSGFDTSDSSDEKKKQL